MQRSGPGFACAGLPFLARNTASSLLILRGSSGETRPGWLHLALRPGEGPLRPVLHVRQRTARADDDRYPGIALDDETPVGNVTRLGGARPFAGLRA